MKKVCVFLYSVVGLFFRFVVAVLSVFLFSSFGTNRNLNRIRKSKSRKECVVFGNGPSLSKLIDYYSEMMCNYDTIALNFFCNTDLFNRVKPTYYILLDPALFEYPYDSDVKTMIDRFNSVRWNMILFLPVKNKRSSIVKDVNNSFVHIYFYNSTPIEVNNGIDHVFFKYNLGMPCPETVVIAAIFQMINLHYDIIHLYGVEQSWLKMIHIDNDNRLTVGLEHFYGVTDEDSSKRFLYEFLESQARAFKSNVRLSKYAEYLGVKIVNHTPGSYLDAYQKQIPTI